METTDSETTENSEVQEKQDENTTLTNVYCVRCENTIELQEFINQNKEMIDKVSKESKYSMYKKPNSQHEAVLNLISTKLKVKDSNDDLIYDYYRDLRNRDYPKKEMEEILQDAQKNSYKSFHSLRSFNCKYKSTEAMACITSSLLNERKQIPVVIEGRDPTSLWIMPRNKLFGFQGNADVQTDTDMVENLQVRFEVAVVNYSLKLFIYRKTIHGASRSMLTLKSFYAH